ncbi:hypothetical protein ACVWZL_000499 [Bradyrhizobium sp. GM2.4]
MGEPGDQLGIAAYVHRVTSSDLSGGLPVSAQAFAGEVEPMGIEDEAIDDGIGEG